MRSFPSPRTFRMSRMSWKVLAVVASMSLVAAACGGGGGKKAATGQTGATAAPGEGTPKAGGNLIIGVTSEVSGMDPSKDRWDTSGSMYAFSVFDPLATYGKDGKVHPYLAQSLDHNADYTEWTIKLRSGVTFSNGDPLTADDVVFDLNAYRKAPLTGPPLASIASVDKIDPLTVSVKTKEPWVPFDAYMTTQVGVVASPKQLQSSNSSNNPIGTGPFTLKEWIRGSHFIATKNAHYWQSGLPYLDQVEYRPIIDDQARESSLVSGTIDVMFAGTTQNIVDTRANKSLKTIDNGKAVTNSDVGFVQLNTAVAPFNNILARQALAYATDRKRVIDTVDNGLLTPADGPLANPTSPYHSTTSYPAFDLTKAKSLVQQYQQQTGKPLSFELGSTNQTVATKHATLLQDMWSQAGMQVSLKQVEQDPFIVNAVIGKYQAYVWAQYGEPDPDIDYTWWHSALAGPVGGFALNFARNKDTQVDAALAAGRHATDQAQRVKAYQDIADRFAVDLPYIWLGVTLNQIAFKPNVHGFLDWKLPDGSPGYDYLLVSYQPGGFLAGHVWAG